MEKVNEFVGYGRSKEFVHKVHDLCGFDNMKKGKEFTNNPISWRDGQAKMFRKGIWNIYKSYTVNVMFTFLPEFLHDGCVDKAGEVYSSCDPFLTISFS